MSAPEEIVHASRGWNRHAIRRLWAGVDVSALRNELLAHPELWNMHRPRTSSYVHSRVDDIWVRYNAWENYNPALGLSHFNREHESVWYPAGEVLLAARQVAFDVLRMVEGNRIGGVLITRIPPGGEVRPHIDRGWHAEYYDKFAVQIQADTRQAFHFEDESLVSAAGDVFTFDNARTHWVTNASDIDRITMIVCIRLDHPRSYLWSKE